MGIIRLVNLMLFMMIVLCLSFALAKGGFVDCHDDCHDDFDSCLDDCEGQSVYGVCAGNCNSTHSTCMSSCQGFDEDGDGVDDEDDAIVGDNTDVQFEGIDDFYIMVGTANSTQASASTTKDVETVVFYADAVPVVDFTMDFNNSVLDVTGLQVKKQMTDYNKNGLIIHGLKSNNSIIKSIYLEKSGNKGLCVADKEIEDISEFSKYCDGNMEYYFGDCENDETIGNITCTIENGMFKLTGLRYSGAVELDYPGLYTGYFTVNYPNKLKGHKDGIIIPGESVELCFETPRPLYDDEYLRLSFVPQYGSITLNELYLPEYIASYNVHLYP